jgi:hypothetical protein
VEIQLLVEIQPGIAADGRIGSDGTGDDTASRDGAAQPVAVRTELEVGQGRGSGDRSRNLVQVY